MSEFIDDWYGTVRYMTPTQVVVYNINEVKCECGNAASVTIIGKESYVARCKDCSTKRVSNE